MDQIKYRFGGGGGEGLSGVPGAGGWGCNGQRRQNSQQSHPRVDIFTELTTWEKAETWLLWGEVPKLQIQKLRRRGRR